MSESGSPKAEGVVTSSCPLAGNPIRSASGQAERTGTACAILHSAVASLERRLLQEDFSMGLYDRWVLPPVLDFVMRQRLLAPIGRVLSRPLGAK
jgi:hypothetical protein